MMDRKYYQDPYLTRFQSHVVSSTKKGGKYHTILKDTIFYPEGGGQPSDEGHINNISVSYVYEEQGEVYHVTEEKIVEKEVICEIDWPRRFTFMQHHSGQHLLSAVLYQEKSMNTCGFHLGEDYATIDIDTNKFDEDLQDRIEDLVNMYIVKDIPITSYFKSLEEIGSISVRKSPEVKEDIRIVEIANLDYSPCCGIHLNSSGQIGLLKIDGAEKCRQLLRIYFRCGQRAFQDYRDKHKTIIDLCNRLSAPPDQVLLRFQKEMEKQSRLNVMNKQLKEELLKYKALEAMKEVEGNVLAMELDEYLWDDAPKLAKEILSLGPYIVLLSAGTRLFFFSHNGSDFHCGNQVQECASRFQGKGGGSQQAAQIQFLTKGQLAECIGYVKDVSSSRF